MVVAVGNDVWAVGEAFGDSYDFLGLGSTVEVEIRSVVHDLHVYRVRIKNIVTIHR